MLWAYEAYEAEFSGERGERLPPSADSFHRPRTPSTAAAVPLPRRGRSLGIRRSKPAALPSIGYRGFAVAPMTLRASSRNIVVITVTGAAIYETGAQCAPLRGTAMQPSVANASNRCNDAAQRCKRISSLRFLPRCRGAHRAPVDIPQTLDFPIPIPPSSREGDRPVGGGRSNQALEGVKTPPGGIFLSAGFLLCP